MTHKFDATSSGVDISSIENEKSVSQSCTGLLRAEKTRHGFCVVRICQGTIEGRHFYAYIAIEPHNYDYFKKHYEALRQSDFSLYGKELLRGWGEAPPSSVHALVQQKYDIEFDVDPKFLERLLAITKESPPRPGDRVSPKKPADVSGS